jgi:hypothetical protein
MDKQPIGWDKLDLDAIESEVFDHAVDIALGRRIACDEFVDAEVVEIVR